MRFLHFTPWQSTETNIPLSSSTDTDVPLIMVSQPRKFTQSKNKGGIKGRSSSSSSNHKQKEIHRLKIGTKIDKSDLIPVMVLTTKYHLSVLGKRRKDLSKYDDDDDDGGGFGFGADAPLIEIPEWIYTCKPTSATAFLSPSLNHTPPSQEGKGQNDYYYLVPPVPAVIDPQRRFVYALQAQNHTLSAWSLDADVGGPDMDKDKLIQKYKFDTPIVSLQLLPERRSHRIHGSSNNTKTTTSTSFMDVTGGVAGLFATGDVFVAFHTASSDGMSGDKLVVGIFKESNLGKSLKVATKGQCQLLLSMVGYTSTTSLSSTTTEHVGFNNTHEKTRKRKSSDIEDESGLGDKGDIVIYTLAKAQSNDSVVLSRHTIEMSSLLFVLQNDYDTHIQRSSKPLSLYNQTPSFNVNGNYFIQSNLLSIPHNNTQHIFATQLDATHVSLVYNYSTSTSTKVRPWLCSLLDMRRGSLSSHPFQVSDLSQDTEHVVKVAGISSALISVLSSNGIIKICDVRRAAIVNVTKLQSSLPDYDPNYYTNHIELSSEWQTGSLCIIMHPKLGVQKNNTHHAKVYTSQIRLQDNDHEVSHRTLKGSYNLASILASSIIASKALDTPTLMENSHLASIRDIKSVHPTLRSKTRPGYTEINVNLEFKESLHILENFRSERSITRGASETFSKVYRQMLERFTNLEYTKEEKVTPKQLTVYKNGKNGIHHANEKNKTSSEGSLRISREDLSNTAASVAIDIILSSDVDDAYLLETMQTLLDIIETGEVSARLAFDSKKFNDRTLYILLMKLNQKIAPKKLIVKLICRILDCCPESLPEYMLVILVDFVLCHLTATQLVESYDHMKTLNLRSTVHELFQRLKMSQEHRIEMNGDSSSFKDRLALSLKRSLIDAIVSYSRCNSTLLRAALRRDLQNSTKGEVEVLFHFLVSLLRKGSDVHVDVQRRKSRMISILNWLAALVDSHLGSFSALTSSGAGSPLLPLADRVRKDISLMICQGELLATLDDILIHFDPLVTRNHSKSSINSILMSAKQVSTPDYSIEPLIF